MKQLCGIKTLMIYLVGMLAAGICHMNEKTGVPYLDTLMFCLTFTIYSSLIISWAISVKQRLLPSKPRSYMLWSAALMLVFLVMRCIKYRVVTYYGGVPERYSWYAYYIPMALAPALFLMTEISIFKINIENRRNERFALIPAFIFLAFIFTNDLHFLVFKPLNGDIIGDLPEEHNQGILFYVFVAYVVVFVVLGIVYLTKAMHKKVLAPAVIITSVTALFIAADLLQGKGKTAPFNVPEIAIFTVFAIYESCIRARLIPYNENYEGFFAEMRYPAIITDKSYRTVYQSKSARISDFASLTNTLNTPMVLDENTKLIGKIIKAGYAFWTEDESELNRMNAKLFDANETLSLENELIQREMELRQDMIEVESRNRIYAEIAERMYPAQKRVSALLEELKPNTPEFKAILAEISVINAFIKRASNLLLIDEGSDTVSLEELKTAIQESAQYFRFCGIEISIAVFDSGIISRSTAFNIYEDFENKCEALISKCTAIEVRYTDGKLTVTEKGGDVL